MFPRQKQTILGVLGSLLTIVLLYHVLSLNGLYYFKAGTFLDSSELTNYTFLDSLLTNKKVEYNGLTALKEETVYSQAEVNHISYSVHFTTSPTSTVLIYFDINDADILKAQLNAVFRQTSHYSNTVWIACSEDEKTLVDQVISIHFSAFDTMIKLVHTTDTRELYTKLAFQSRTDFIFIFDRQVVPGRSYFDFILRLLHTPAFHSSLLETAPVCKDDADHIAYHKGIHHILVLRKSWISSLLPSLLSHNKNDISLDNKMTIQAQASLISHTLNLPTATIPVSEKDLYANIDKEYCIDNTELVSSVDILFIADNDALAQFACQFDSTLSIAVIAFNHSIVDNPCKNGNIQFHSIHPSKVEEQVENQMMALEYWINRHLPSVILKTKEDSSNNNNKQTLLDLVLSRFESPTKINIPQDTSLVSWMSHLSLSAIQQWHVPKIKLIVSGSHKNGGKELKSLLGSAARASYFGDEVGLSIVLDEKSGKGVFKSAEQLAWQHGRKEIRHRISGVEPMQVFVESWYPSNDHEYAVLLDERIELSNAFYAWLKYSLLKYRYSDDAKRGSLFGISLTTPRILDTDPTQRRLFQPTGDLKKHGYDTTTPILLQSASHFGTLYFPEHWREFHDYITARLTDQGIANKKKKMKHLLKDYVLTEARSNKWMYSWRKYFDEMIYMRGYVLLYPHQSYSSLTHVSTKIEKYPDIEKLFKVALAADRLPKTPLPTYEALPVFDLWGRMSSGSDMLKKGHKLQRKFSACEPLLLQHDPSDMLCPFGQMTEIPIEVDPDTLPTLTVHIPRATPV